MFYTCLSVILFTVATKAGGTHPTGMHTRFFVLSFFTRGNMDWTFENTTGKQYLNEADHSTFPPEIVDKFIVFDDKRIKSKGFNSRIS